MFTLKKRLILGAVYLDFPGDLLGRTTSGEEVENPLPVPEPPKSCAELSDIARAVELLKSAKRPLLVVGKGAAYSRAEKTVNQFVKVTNIPVSLFPYVVRVLFSYSYGLTYQ